MIEIPEGTPQTETIDKNKNKRTNKYQNTMKKFFLTTAILLGMTLGAFAEWNSNESGWILFNLFNSNEDEQEEANVGLFENDEINQILWENVVETPSFKINFEEGGMFGRGKSMYMGVGSGFRNNSLFLPDVHGNPDDASAPLGSGMVVLMSLGAAYAIAKKRREE